MENPVVEIEKQFEQEVSKLHPYDASVWLGYTAKGRIVYRDISSLQAALSRQQIKNALISHTMGELYDVALSNEILKQALKEQAGFGGVMTLLPEGTGEIENLSNYIEKGIEAGMRAARLFPKSHRFSLTSPNIPSLLTTLENLGMPLFIPIGETHWEQMAAIAGHYPRLAILLEGVGHHEYLNNRTCLPWLVERPNLLVPTHNQLLCGGLELMVDQLGPHRIFFASNQPMDDPAAGLSLLVYNDLAPAIRRQIAHGNLKKLIAGVGRGGYFA